MESDPHDTPEMDLTNGRWLAEQYKSAPDLATVHEVTRYINQEILRGTRFTKNKAVMARLKQIREESEKKWQNQK